LAHRAGFDVLFDVRMHAWPVIISGEEFVGLLYSGVSDVAWVVCFSDKPFASTGVIGACIAALSPCKLIRLLESIRCWHFLASLCNSRQSYHKFECRLALGSALARGFGRGYLFLLAVGRLFAIAHRLLSSFQPST